MMATKGHIGFFGAIAATVLLASFALAGAEKATDDASGSRQTIRGGNSGVYSPSQKSQTAYDILRRTRRQQSVDKTPEVLAPSPVVAKADMRPVRSMGIGPVGYLAMQRQGTTLTRPPELRAQEVPADAPKEPVYFVVRVGDRNVPGITYRSTHSGRGVKLLLDADGDGLLSDEREYLGTWLSLFRLTMTYQFGPVSTRRADTGTAAGLFHAQCSDGRWLIFYPALYREGRVVLEGKAYKIAVVDCDFDGRYDKVFVPPAKGSREPGCDVFAIDLNGDSKFDFDKPGESELMPLSRLVRVKGHYYSIDVAEDGSTVEFRRAEPKFGYLDMKGKSVKLGLWSNASQQLLSSSGGKLRVPAGRYGTVSMELNERDSAGNRWSFKIGKAGAGELADFEVRPGQTTSFGIGPPFQIRTSIQETGENVLVGFELEGQAGESYVPGATRNGKTVPEPQYKIIDSSGQVAASGQFEFR